MSYTEHFERECELLGWNDKDSDGYEMQQLMIENVKEVLNVIGEQGHSGFSINYFKNLLNKAIMFEPIGPLTGKDDEWNEVSGGTYQNKRCSSVFKESKDGEAYYMDGYVFRENEDCSYYGTRASRKYIKFPYTLEKTVYITLNVDRNTNVTDEMYAEAIKKYEETI